MFRKTGEKDIKPVMRIIQDAQRFLKENGVDQWQNGYPNEETILADINNKYGYVLVKKNEIVGTVSLSFDGESTYDDIYEGQWLSKESYAVVHRFAVREDYRGSQVATQMFKEVEEICRGEGINNIKIDTHEENQAMQRFLKKQGYQYCGVIYLRDGNKRIAFEKCI